MSNSSAAFAFWPGFESCLIREWPILGDWLLCLRAMRIVRRPRLRLDHAVFGRSSFKLMALIYMKPKALYIDE
jgi:hypothetical protein